MPAYGTVVGDNSRMGNYGGGYGRGRFGMRQVPQPQMAQDAINAPAGPTQATLGAADVGQNAMAAQDMMRQRMLRQLMMSRFQGMPQAGGGGSMWGQQGPPQQSLGPAPQPQFGAAAQGVQQQYLDAAPAGQQRLPSGGVAINPMSGGNMTVSPYRSYGVGGPAPQAPPQQSSLQAGGPGGWDQAMARMRQQLGPENSRQFQGAPQGPPQQFLGAAPQGQFPQQAMDIQNILRGMRQRPGSIYGL